MYYKLEYGNFQYTAEFHNSDDEEPLDKLLYFYDSIAQLYLLGSVTLSDLKYRAYEYLVVYQNPGVQAYLQFLDHWYGWRGIEVKPFDAFRAVGKELAAKYYRKSQVDEEAGRNREATLKKGVQH